ncbi:MAG: ABC transporter substrate-binding protein [Candidatus Bipolaricaulia bacterium]
MKRWAVVLALVVTLAFGVQAVAQVPRGGIVRWNPHPAGPWPDTYNPFSPGLEQNWVLIYEPLLHFNELTVEIEPWLAESYAWNDDLRTVTFEIRPSVQWHDGELLTAEDVEFTFNLMKEFPALDTQSVWAILESVQAVDQDTIVMKLKQVSVPSLWYIAEQVPIVPQHIWSTVRDPVTFVNRKPVGTGPFKLGRYRPEVIRFDRNPDYWQPGKPYVDGVEVVAFKLNDDAFLALLRHELDYVNNFIPDIEKTFVSRDPEDNHYWFAPNGVVTLYTNTARYPLSLREVRWAIAMAIDRKELVDKAYYNYGEPASPAGPVMVPTLTDWWNSSIPATFTLDPERSIRILEGLGFERGRDGIFVTPDGKRLEFSIIVVNGWTDWVAECQLMAQQLKKIGMDVTVEALDFGAYFSKLQRGDFDLGISWTTFGPSPFFGYSDLLHSKFSAPVGETAMGTNWHRWTSDQVDALLDAFASTADPEEQKGILYNLQSIFFHELPSIPLHYSAMWYEYVTENFVGWPDVSNPYAMGGPGSTIAESAKVLSNVHLKK